MREIKFRAWNPVDMEMIADPLVYDDVGINDNFENFKDDEYYLMQFTGLLDKEGKEIYEGDIVRYNMIDGEDICEVFWDVGTVKMKFRELVLRNRSYRRFFQEISIDPETLRQLVDLARLSASASNLQPLKYILSCEQHKNTSVFPHLADQKYLPITSHCI